MTNRTTRTGKQKYAALLDNLRTLTDFWGGQMRFCELMDLHRVHLAKMLAGERGITLTMLFDMAERLGIPAEHFFMAPGTFKRKHGSRLKDIVGEHETAGR